MARAIVKLLAEGAASPNPSIGVSEIVGRIESIKRLVEQLGQTLSEGSDAHELVKRILRGLDTLRPPQDG